SRTSQSRARSARRYGARPAVRSRTSPPPRAASRSGVTISRSSLCSSIVSRQRSMIAGRSPSQYVHVVIGSFLGCQAAVSLGRVDVVERGGELLGRGLKAQIGDDALQLAARIGQQVGVADGEMLDARQVASLLLPE